MNLADLNRLDFNNVGGWPAPAKFIFAVIVAGATAFAGYYFDIQELLQKKEGVVLREAELRQEFLQKTRVTAHLPAYREQIVEIEKLLATMLRQLPTSTEMPDLLEDISNLGRTNGLVFELFKPEAELPREFYAAKPISIRATGTYHQFGAFVSAVAALPRIVTVEAATVAAPGRDGDDERLQITATLQTYRYLDADEVAGATGASQ